MTTQFKKFVKKSVIPAGLRNCAGIHRRSIYVQHFLLAMSLAISASTFAQSTARPIPKDATPIEDIAPPPDTTNTTNTKPTESTNLLPTVTTKKEGDKLIEEYRIMGKLYQLKITPGNGSAYYVVDNIGNGIFTKMDGPGPKYTPPKWVVKEF